MTRAVGSDTSRPRLGDYIAGIPLKVREYVKGTRPIVVALDVLRGLALFSATPLAIAAFGWAAKQDVLVAPLHRQLWAHPTDRPEALVYGAFLVLAFVSNAAWMTTALRNFIAITMSQSQSLTAGPQRPGDKEKVPLPPYPYSRESFCLVLGELQDRDGARVPNERAPHLTPRWLTLPELALYTGVFVTGGIGSGKTSAVAYPALKQLLGFRRPVRVRRKDGSIAEQDWKFSGLILDEKGDFTRAAAEYCDHWGRSGDLIRISPGGQWIWNVIYNPNIPTWAVGYQLGGSFGSSTRGRVPATRFGRTPRGNW